MRDKGVFVYREWLTLRAIAKGSMMSTVGGTPVIDLRLMTQCDRCDHPPFLARGARQKTLQKVLLVHAI